MDWRIWKNDHQGQDCLRFLRTVRAGTSIQTQAPAPTVSPRRSRPGLGKQQRPCRPLGHMLTDIPRVYYGSGERRFLGRRPSFLTISESGDSRPPSSGFLGSESPNTDNFPQTIFSPRKRPREIPPNAGQQFPSDRASMEISPAAPVQEYSVFRTIKQKTSSIWSPHLQTDRRATRYSVWDPPNVDWSADSGIFGRRNAQVVLFILGFILPLCKFLGQSHHYQGN